MITFFGLLAAGSTMLFLPSVLRVLAPVLELAVRGISEFLRALWHGVKTSNYGTWTLVGTALVIGLFWNTGSCVSSASIARDTPASQSMFTTNQGRGAVTHITKQEASIFESARDVFCRWFGCF